MESLKETKVQNVKTQLLHAVRQMRIICDMDPDEVRKLIELWNKLSDTMASEPENSIPTGHPVIHALRSGALCAVKYDIIERQD